MRKDVIEVPYFRPALKIAYIRNEIEEIAERDVQAAQLLEVRSLEPAPVDTMVGRPDAMASTAVKLNTSQVDGTRLNKAACWRIATSDGVTCGCWRTFRPQISG